MQAMHPTAPDFDAVGDDAETDPGSRPRYGPPPKPTAQASHRGQQLTAADDLGALSRGKTGETARSRPTFPVGICLGVQRSLDSSLDSHLLVRSVPIEYGRGDGILPQFLSLSATRVGEEEETATIYLLQQNKACRCAAIGCARRNYHGFRERLASPLGLGEQPPETCNGVRPVASPSLRERGRRANPNHGHPYPRPFHQQDRDDSARFAASLGNAFAIFSSVPRPWKMA
jgi:hypothetical protein